MALENAESAVKFLYGFITSNISFLISIFIFKTFQSLSQHYRTLLIRESLTPLQTGCRGSWHCFLHISKQHCCFLRHHILRKLLAHIHETNLALNQPQLSLKCCKYSSVSHKTRLKLLPYKTILSVIIKIASPHQGWGSVSSVIWSSSNQTFPSRTSKNPKQPFPSLINKQMVQVTLTF